MKRIFRILACAVFLAAVVPLVNAQDCSNWSAWDLRGTYTLAGSGWLDLSKVLPRAGLPSALAPMNWVASHALNGAGGGTGWVSFNVAGGQLNAQLVGLKYSMNSDCSFQVTWSLTVKELGVTVGPFTRFGVIAGRPDALELHSLLIGTPPGMAAGPGLDLGVARRISTQY